jgi:hypothetical protein
MNISACSVNSQKEIPILPDDSLLISPCQPKWEFYNPREQGVLFIENYACIEAYELKLESLRDWKTKQWKIYNDNAKQ